MLSTGTALTRVAPAPGAEPPRRLNATVPDSRPSTATRSTTMPSTSPAQHGTAAGARLDRREQQQLGRGTAAVRAVMPLNTVLARAGMRCNSP